jgi:S-DNA-T family DNA segregation ATPase FtsK/SpoIIIE
MAGGGRINRVHGPFVSDEEVERVVGYLKTQGQPEYIEEVVQEEAADDSAGGPGGDQTSDVLYDDAVALIAREGKASTSFIQRHLQIGYNRAARIIEQMEKDGVVSLANRVGRREVLIGHHGD